MERKKIKTHFQLRKYLKKKDLRNLDLSSLNLSKYPESTWYDCLFGNTDVHNTGIRIILEQVAKQQIERYSTAQTIYNCDFSGNDLSNQTLSIGQIDIQGTNLRKTNLKIVIHDLYSLAHNFKGTLFPDHQPIDLTGFIYSKVDETALKENPHVTFLSETIFKSIYETIPSFCYPIEEVQQHLAYCLNMMSSDRQGKIIKTYERIAKNLSQRDQLEFFQRSLRNQTFTNLVIDKDMCDVLSPVTIANCVFINPIFDMTYSELIKSSGINVFFNTNKVINPQFPKITPSSWQEYQNEYSRSESERIGYSDYTFRTSVYVELSRDCPCRCKFCRNNSYDNCCYDFESIKKVLQSLTPYVNDIVIGGGEPSLKLGDAINLKYNIRRRDIVIFTNGMMKPETAHKIINEGFNINLSRHAIDDEENAQIFGVNPNKLLSEKDLTTLQTSAITLCPTLFKGGLDTPEKIINYIRFAFDHHITKILFQTLHKDASLGNNELNYEQSYIDESVLESVKKYLLSIGYNESVPIYSSGGYKLTIFTHPTSRLHQESVKISFKEYIPEKELEKAWPNAIKRTFDLSINPSGQIFENWHQKSSPILSLKNTNHQD